MKKLWLLGFVLFLLLPQVTFGFDHSHSRWDGLLKRHVHWDVKGVASTVDYAALKQHAELGAYLSELSAVTFKDYSAWSKPQPLSFLINAYNAFTVELILSKYPDIESIKDLGSFFTSPWKIDFFTLLGKERNLDGLEHKLIRQPGVFDDPRIHASVVCASIGCPGIRNEAFVAEQLDAQLEDSLRRFLSDRSRNRYNAKTDELEISKIFDWYSDDFSGYRQHPSVAAFLGDYAELLSDNKNEQLRIKAGDTPLEYLDYDWRLNVYRN